MAKTLNNIQAGDYVKVYSSGYGQPDLAKITKVWKNGVMELAPLDGRPYTSTYSPGGRRRGDHGYSYSRIEPPADGETVESIQAEITARTDAARAERERKAQERRDKIAAWWADEGQAIWQNRVAVPGGFAGKEVVILRFTRHGEERMPFVTLRQEADRWDREGKLQWVAEVGGLSASRYNDTCDGGKEVVSISTYSQSTVRAETLEEALYDICN